MRQGREREGALDHWWTLTLKVGVQLGTLSVPHSATNNFGNHSAKNKIK